MNSAPVSRRRFTIGSLLPAFGLLLAIGIWWWASADSTSLYFPPLADIWASFSENWLSPRAADHLLPSLGRFFAGFGIASLVGVMIGMMLGISPTWERALRPQIEFLRSTPPVLLLPVSLLLFGTGAGMKVFVIALGSMWPVLIATTSGVRATDRIALDMAKLFGLSLSARVWKVIVPGSAPAILAGMRSALPIALVLMVVTELVASTDGIGYFILRAQQQYELVDMWSGVLLLGVIGMVLSLLLDLAQRRVHARVQPTAASSQS